MVLYDGLDQVILSVGLVRPRDGVFVDEVKWLLVLTTPVEIVLLAVTFEDVESGDLLEPSVSNGIGYGDSTSASYSRRPASSHQGDLKLNPTKFSVPTDNVNMLRVVGSSKGRVFMTGRDGSLNELLYQPEDGWFSRKCRKLNHTASKMTSFIPSFLRFQTEESLENIAIDEQRNILYTLSSTNTLAAYDLGMDGEKLEQVASIKTLVTDVIKTATQRFEGLDKHALDIMSMHVVEPTESLNVHLVCVTRGGHRLYFTTYARSVSSRFNAATRPKRLHLLHVRFPPSLGDLHGPSSSGSRSSTIDSVMSYYNQGLFLCSHIESESSDHLISTSSDCAVVANPRLGSRIILPEEPELRPVDAKVLSIAESPLNQLLNAEYLPLVNTTESVARNELAQQHSLPPRQVVVLTNSGLHLLEKARPVEHLKDLLVASRGADSPGLRKFFADYGTEQACAMCLVVATSAMTSSSINGGLSDAGTPGGAALSTGGGPGARSQRALPPNRREPELVSWATMAFFRLGGRPSVQSNDGDAAGPSYARIHLSGSHDGFALFLARLLQPIWASNIFVVKDTGFSVRLNQEQFTQLEWHLVRLRHFLRQNQQFAAIRRSNDSNSRTTNATPVRTMHEDVAFEEALKAEQQSLSNLHMLLIRSLEAIAFLSIMSETDLSAVQLSRVTKPKVGSFKFKDLVVLSDPEIVRELIHGMTTVYSQNATEDGANMSVEELTLTLRQNCPSFFSDTDKTRLKAMDLLFRARSPSEHLSWFERLQLLQQSLDYFRTIASDILPILPEICHDFQYLNFFEGVVELALECATSVDSNRAVSEWYKAGQPSARSSAPGTSPSVIAASASAKDLLPQLESCYQQIIFVLNEIYGLEEVGANRSSAFSKSRSSNEQSITAALAAAASSSGSQSAAGASGSSSLSSMSGAVARPELNENEWRQLQSRTLKACRASSDDVFHIAFYQWFIDHNLATEMLQQETEDLEPFLRFYCKPLELRMHLLWQFYLHRGELAKAGHILLQLAEQRGADQTLSDRLGHLAQSLSLLKASPSDHQLLREVQEKVEVGTVQLKIYNELETVANAAQRTEARRQLDFELFTISDLFNQFAKKFGLSESALAILHVSGHQDTRLARRLWDTMISDYSQQMQSQGPPFNTAPLAETVFNLVAEYYPSEYVLPMDFLVDSLEQTACRFPSSSTILDAAAAASSSATTFQQGLSSTLMSNTSDSAWYRGWVVNSFLRAQIPAPVLYKLYTHLLEARLNFWIVPEHALHLTAQIAYILEAWKAELPSEAVRTQEARLLRAKVDSAIDKHIALLQGLSAPRAFALVQMLRSLKR